MINLSLQVVADKLNGQLIGNDLFFKGCSTDTRSIKNNELFIALHGPSFDGHDYLSVAKDSGAVAAIVDKEVNQDNLDGFSLIKVTDTRRALGDLAGIWRDRFSFPIISITGSNGKTTVKEMTSAILREGGNVIATKGNFNNDIGLPLTLFGLGKEHDYAVIEMGANHAGEIARLCEIAKPDVVVVTQCAPSHLEGFGSVDGVANAKGEIFTSLGGDEEKVAIINADDPYADLWKSMAKTSLVVTFGLDQHMTEHHANVTASIASMGTTSSQFTLRIFDEEIDVKLPLPGRHNIMNALAAAACSYAVGVELENIQSGLEKLEGVPGRLQFKEGINNSHIIDDTYNANPRSYAAALDVLINSTGRHWLVLGDMGELGTEAEKSHSEAGELARMAGVERLFTFGSLSKNTTEAFGDGGQHFDEQEKLITIIKSELDKDITLLIKGSRSSHMEWVVQALESDNATISC